MIDLQSIKAQLELAQANCQDQATQHLINALELLVLVLERQGKSK